ncbi:MAG: hypothetical protein A6F71_09805 [Cycloclasticus sp. symbiont of Poecilosclerida sp. M]|nr:MAG: hypothetical protein A6F71_09805 [Cycloclasticus sp. symbiont of Poecilosclerida sp. M]
MSYILEGLEGITCLIDDVLIAGEAEHDAKLTRALQRIEDAGVTLNKEKCVFKKPSVKFLGQLISKDGIQADPEKTKRDGGTVGIGDEKIPRHGEPAREVFSTYLRAHTALTRAAQLKTRVGVKSKHSVKSKRSFRSQQHWCYTTLKRS